MDWSRFLEKLIDSFSSESVDPQPMLKDSELDGSTEQDGTETDNNSENETREEILLRAAINNFFERTGRSASMIDADSGDMLNKTIQLGNADEEASRARRQLAEVMGNNPRLNDSEIGLRKVGKLLKDQMEEEKRRFSSASKGGELVDLLRSEGTKWMGRGVLDQYIDEVRKAEQEPNESQREQKLSELDARVRHIARSAEDDGKIISSQTRDFQEISSRVRITLNREAEFALGEMISVREDRPEVYSRMIGQINSIQRAVADHFRGSDQGLERLVDEYRRIGQAGQDLDMDLTEIFEQIKADARRSAKQADSGELAGNSVSAQVVESVDEDLDDLREKIHEVTANMPDASPDVEEPARHY